MKSLVAACLLTFFGALPAQADLVVKIGHAGPTTGPLAHIGKDGENGARLALEDANARGLSIGGQKLRFELMGEDDQSDPRVATTVAQRLTDAGVKGVVGHVTSGASLPASRIYAQAGVPVITPSSTNPLLTRQGYKVTFRVIANDLQQGEAMARYAVGKLGAKRVALIDDRTAYGQGLADAMADSLKKQGAQVVGREYTTDKATDFLAILTKLRASNPDAVFYGGMDAQAAPMLRQFRQLGFKAYFLGGDGVCTSEMPKLAAGAIDARTFCSRAGIAMEKMPGGLAFRERFRKRFNVDVQLYAPYSYDAAQALVAAMVAANSVEPAKYLPALQKLSFDGVTGHIAFDAQGDIRDGGISLFSYKEGAWVPAN